MTTERAHSATEAVEQEEAALLKRLEEVRQKKAKIAELEAEAAKYGFLLAPSAGDGTISSLIASYKASPGYLGLRYRSKRNYDSILRMIETKVGAEKIENLANQSRLAELHHDWTDDGRHIPMAYSLMGALRRIATFGSMQNVRACRDLKIVLHDMEFPKGQARVVRLTQQQAEGIRAKAHENGWHSVALVQALQFNTELRQRDIIGEWVPRDEPVPREPGDIEIFNGAEKWVRGLRWCHIDDNLVLKHVTSKTQKPIKIELANKPMVAEEIHRMGGPLTDGPLIVSELHERPYADHEFRYLWRKCATAAGVPKGVFNMDSGRKTETLTS